MTDNPLGKPAPEVHSECTPLTWTGLLAHWVQLAQAASLLPDDEQGTNWKQSVVPAITLHAVAMALADLHRLEPGERALALDRAEILIKRESNALTRAWRDGALPSKLDDLIHDAHDAFERAQSDHSDGP